MNTSGWELGPIWPPWTSTKPNSSVAAKPKPESPPFDRLVDQVMQQHPYRRARRVFWIVDNGSSHRGPRAVQRLQGKYPNLVLVHGPVHASWLNQIEIYFSIIQRKVLTPNDFSSR